MGIENAKLVAIPVKSFTKTEVLAKMEEVCEQVMDLVTDAVNREICVYNIPVCLGAAVETLVEDPHSRCLLPKEHEIKEMLEAVVGGCHENGHTTLATIDEYYWDGDIFECNVSFKNGVTNE